MDFQAADDKPVKLPLLIDEEATDTQHKIIGHLERIEKAINIQEAEERCFVSSTCFFKLLHLTGLAV